LLLIKNRSSIKIKKEDGAILSKQINSTNCAPWGARAFVTRVFQNIISKSI
jgi:hypothetical protein